MNEDAARPPRAPMGRATRVLHDIVDELEARAALTAPETDEGGGRAPAASLGDVVDRLDERAFGLMLLLLALPCCLPFVYGLPQIVALPMLALAGQMAMGRTAPWLPGALRRRTFSLPAFKSVLARSGKYVAFIEKVARPRFRAATGHGAARIVGFILLAPIASILTPLPGTNTVPGIGVAIAALGLIERDGALLVLGLLIGVAWVALLLFFGLEAASIIKAWLAARF